MHGGWSPTRGNHRASELEVFKSVANSVETHKISFKCKRKLGWDVTFSHACPSSTWTSHTHWHVVHKIFSKTRHKSTGKKWRGKNAEEKPPLQPSLLLGGNWGTEALLTLRRAGELQETGCRQVWNIHELQQLNKGNKNIDFVLFWSEAMVS